MIFRYNIMTVVLIGLVSPVLAALGYITWDVNPEIGIHIGPFNPRWYGILFASGFLIGYQLMSKMMERERRPVTDMEPLTFYMILGTLVGMRLGHCLFYDPVHYLTHPLEILKIWEGGYASHGAVIGISVALWLYSRSRPQQPFLWIIDRIAITTALAAFLIRTGNFFNHEMIGKPSDVPWAVVFTMKDMTPRHPAQMYEAFCYLGIFFLMRWLYNRYHASPPQGMLLGVFFVTIFGVRFVVEFFKENQVLFEQLLPINMGQILSIPLVLVGAGLIWWALQRQKRGEGLNGSTARQHNAAPSKAKQALQTSTRKKK